MEDLIPEGYRVIYCRYIHKNNRIIYPKNAKYFRFLVKEK